MQLVAYLDISWHFFQDDIFSSWNLFIDFYSLETNFLHGTYFVLIFFLKTCCMVIFLFMKLVYWFFSSLNWFFSWNLFRVDLFHEICCILIFLFVQVVRWLFLIMKLIVFVKFVTCWFLFLGLAVCWFLLVKLVAYWFFSLWNLCIDISCRKVDLCS